MASNYNLPLDTTNTQINPSSAESLSLLQKIADLLESSGVVDSQQRQRVIVDIAASSPALAANTVSLGYVVAQFGQSAATAANIEDSRYFLVDIAHEAYANGLRSKLTW